MPAAQNPIFIGAKPPMNYVLAIVTQFNGGANEVLLKARGRAISRCVDVAEIVRNRFVEGVDVKNIQIGTERIADERGRQTNVSSIEILLAKGESVDVKVVPKEKEPPTEADPKKPMEVTA